MTPRRPRARVVLAMPLTALAALAALSACSGSDQPTSSASTTSTATASTSPSAAPTVSAPGNRECRDLTYDQVVAPTDEVDPVACSASHTTMTFSVGRFDAVVDGHLLAVDSSKVRDQVAAACPQRFADFVGGSADDRRLSMLRTVWFTPTVEESDAGASWFRCDVVALAADDQLAPLTGRLAQVLDSEEGRNRYGMCGTAQPGSAGFERVICSTDHTWRAVAVVPFDSADYPGVDAARAAGDGPCQDAGAAASGGSLDYQWGYEWPTAAQWRAGQTYGICWVPES